MVGSVTKVFIVISSLILHLECGDDNKNGTNDCGRNGSCEDSHTSVSPSMAEKKEKKKDDQVDDKDDTDEESTTLQTTTKTKTTEKSSSAAEDKENANHEDCRYAEGGKIGVPLVVALIIVAFSVGAAFMTVILCWTHEKWRSRVPCQGTHHARKPSTHISDVIGTSKIHVETGDSIYADLKDNEDLSASNVHVSRGDDHLDQKVPLAPNNYESVCEQGYQRSSLEHPYGSVSLGSDVNQIAINEMERNETRNKEAEHEYFVLAINEADGKNATEGSEMRKTEENHDYFVLASHERDEENGTEGNETGTRELNHDYFVLAPHGHNGK